MDVDVPRSFDAVDVTVEYDNPDHPFVEFGVVTSQEPWAVALYPMENRIIDEALLTWDRKERADGLIVLQRSPTYESVDAFVDHPPTDMAVGIYQYTLTPEYHDANYTPQEGQVVIDRLLRGRHTFITYIKDETLHAEFDLRDMNREFNDDTVTARVYHADELIVEQILADDGVTSATGALSEKRTLTIDLTGLPEAAYRIELIATDDIVIEQLRTAQHKFVVQNHLFVINNEEYRSAFPEINTDATTVSVSAEKLTVHSDHATGVQEITIGEEQLAIAKTSAPHIWVRPQESDVPAYRRLTTPKNDVIVDTKGFFAFTEDSFFDPNYGIEQMNETTTLDELDAILYRNYDSPIVTHGTAVQTQHIALEGVSGDRKHLLFVLSAPGIDREHRMLTVRSVKFTFTRDPLWTRLKNRFFREP
jgi:hypothetical protein